MSKKNFGISMFLIFLVILFLCLIIFKIDCQNFSGAIALLVNIFALISFKKNNLLFFSYMWIFYCNISFLISKYFSSTPTFLTIYNQIRFKDTKIIGVSGVAIFVIISFLLCYNYKNKCKDNFDVNENNVNVTKKSYDISLIIIISIISIVLIDYFALHILSVSRQIYEYLLILFVFGFYYSKMSRRKIYKNLLFVLMIISTVVNMYQGARVISLQPMIAYFFVFYDDLINYKKLIISFIIVILIFTFFGLYGDMLDSGISLKQLTFSYLIDNLLARKFTLDTSIAAYWSGLTFIECTNFIPLHDRITNFLQFLTSYLLFGAKSGYKDVYNISREYYLHYNGGFISSYFYYWLSWPGVILVSIYVGKILKLFLYKDDNEFKKIFKIYVVATIPRWYLYYPTALFRGTFIFIILYILFSKMLNAKYSISKER